MTLTLKDIEELERRAAMCVVRASSAFDPSYARIATTDLEDLLALAKSALSPPELTEEDIISAARAAWHAQENTAAQGPFERARAGVKAALATLGHRPISPPVPEDRAGLVERLRSLADGLEAPSFGISMTEEHAWKHAADLRSAIAILSETRAGPGMEREGWQPIEGEPVNGVAPLTGEPVLIFTDSSWPGERIALARWSDDFFGDGVFAWLVDDHKHGPYPLRGYRKILAWMPLPSPPGSEKP